jgi:tetratricopeptide (TPR) repeat protein
VFATLGRYDEAVAAYEQVLALDTMYASAYTGMSEALLQFGRTQKAKQAREHTEQPSEQAHLKFVIYAIGIKAEIDYTRNSKERGHFLTHL